MPRRAENPLPIFFSESAHRAANCPSHFIIQPQTCPIFAIIPCKTEHTATLWARFSILSDRVTYTKFALDSVEINGNKIRAKVKNIGNFESGTVLQLYMTCPPADFSTPLKYLTAFKRINLKPQETATAEFEIKESSLLSVNNNGNRVLLKGAYKFVLTDGCDFSSEPIEFSV